MLAMLAAIVAIPLTAAALNYGSLTLAATTATVIPAPVRPVGRTSVTILNRDSVSTFCGDTSAVTTTNGTEIEPSASITLRVNEASTAAITIYCYSTPGTAANAVRYWWSFP
jgi:hypothetical protein